MDLFKELGEALRPTKTIIVYLTTGVEVEQVDPSSGAKDIQEFLINKYGVDVLSWES